METSVSRELQSLSAKIGKLASQRDGALGELRRAREEITDLKRELEETRERLRKSELDVEFLTLSHRLADTPEALAEARKTVKKILARVEKAISLLKEDARI